MARGYGRVLLCLTVAVVLLCIILPSASAASHTETYYVTQYRSTYNCYPYTYTYCYNWYYWNYWYYNWYWSPYYYRDYWNPYYGYYSNWPACYSQTSYNCYYTYTSYQVAVQRCSTGWSGTNCDIPVCNPTCSGGQVCAEVNGANTCICTATSSGSACSLTACSNTLNCYPGTCINGNTCKCPAGFTGNNCEKIMQKPTMGACSVKLSATVGGRETVIGTAECAAEVLTPRTTWVGDGLNTADPNYGLTNIEVMWDSNYEFPLSMPSVTSQSFVQNAPVRIGIAAAKYTVIAGASSISYDCPSASSLTPPTSVSCDMSKEWSALNINSAVLRHNGTFTVKMSANLGGHKDGNRGVGYTFVDALTGDEAFLQASFVFDAKPPSHCLLDTGRNCTVFPIFIDQDITTDPVINPKFLEWTDDGSGIYKYHVEVFILGNNGRNSLSKVGNPLGTGDITGSVNNFQFTAPKPGVYSIELTVYDRANNKARARKIFNFNDQPSFETTSNPVFVQEANEKSRYSEFSFITQLDNPNRLNLIWRGRFKSDPQYDEIFKMPVEQWSGNDGIPSIDDQFGLNYGQRSIAAVKNLTGIASLSWAYYVDSTGGGIGIDEPSNSSWTTTDDKSIESALLTFSPPLKDGDTVVLWLKVVGVVGDRSDVRIKTTVDSTPVTVTGATFVKKGVDKYVSTIVIDAKDLQSGINATWYQIRNKRTGTPIYTAYSPAVIRDPPPVARKKRDLIQTPCVPSDTTCYCTPFRKCFAKQQVIKIDHCVIDIYSSSEYTLEVAYKVSNLAGYESSENIFDLGDISGLQCRNPPGLPGGAIAGIVIACIIGFLIIILLVILIITYRRRPEFKERIDRTMRQVRHTVWRHREDQSSQNPVYTSAPPPYTGPGKHYHSKDAEGGFSGVENPGFVKSGKSSSVIARRQLQMQELIGEGRFATITRADLTTNDGDVMVVAAKALKNGFSPADEQLMAKKVLFLKKTPPHGNLVRFIGSINDEGNGEGPIILLELCEYTLKDWLASRRQISTDDLEIMLGFAINIARGVQHLHSCKIYHRRLAVRNVLVQQQANGLVAKLIGFGPTADDSDEAEGGATSGAGVSVPIKWMAPETLDTLQTSKPTYNDKTDAWSYAITIWEMYSKGAAPYDNIRSSDVREKLRQGVRLQCPQDCPPELYTNVLLLCWNERPGKRPKFDAIVKFIDEFRRGADVQQGYYTTNDAAEPPQPLYDNAN